MSFAEVRNGNDLALTCYRSIDDSVEKLSGCLWIVLLACLCWLQLMVVNCGDLDKRRLPVNVSLNCITNHFVIICYDTIAIKMFGHQTIYSPYFIHQKNLLIYRCSFTTISTIFIILAEVNKQNNTIFYYSAMQSGLQSSFALFQTIIHDLSVVDPLRFMFNHNFSFHRMI